MTTKLVKWSIGFFSSALVVSCLAADPNQPPPPPDLPVVRVVATKPIALAGAATGLFTLSRSGGNFDAGLTVFYHLAGTASNGVDYVKLPEQLTIPAGTNVADLIVEGINNPLAPAQVTVVLSLATNADYWVSALAEAKVTIVENRPPNAPPVISLVNPTNGAVFNVPIVTLTAEATDTDDAIAKVRFYADARLVGTVTNTPYTLVWSNAPPGSHRLVAKAIDARGAVTYSKPVYVRVHNAAPVVNLIAPKDGAVFSMPADVTLTATAADADDLVAKVSFYDGERLLGTVTTAPYTLIWTNAPPGSHVLRAKATDQYGLAAASQAVRILVSNALPVVTLVTPTNGAVFATPARITLAAEATDTDDNVASVSFFDSKHLLGVVTNAPFSLVWTNARAGKHSLTAKATDQFGLVGTSAAVKITVTSTPPVVALVAPTNGTVFATPANVALLAEASDADDGIAKVSFYQDDHLLGVATNQPYALTWSNAPAGPHLLFAKATDLAGVTAASAPVFITVSNSPPRVALIAPTNGTVFPYPTNITMTAEASDSDGAITRVRFYANGHLLGSVTSAPYSLTWSNVPPGRYYLVARATDSAGVNKSSAPVRVWVSRTGGRMMAASADPLPIMPTAGPADAIALAGSSATACLTALTDGRRQLSLKGTAGTSVVIEASVDLNDWTPVTMVELPDGSGAYVDEDALTAPRRFYRIVPLQ